ncbi:hypothetical protein [Halorussus salinisoli]|uniref:hypothetical protein n=1 Tax=Halorussus salinisoli TaxID=2558242 RepID=UPI0010C22158|nr:hypothetical protein [Halorussus salinisoli]
MHRRDALRNCLAVGATASLGTLAGCSGGSGDSGSEQSGALSKESFDFREGESGNLVVSVTVKNSGDAEGTGNVYVSVTASERTSETGTDDDDDDTVSARKSRDVTVPAGESKTVTLAFDIGYDQFARKGNIDVDFRT